MSPCDKVNDVALLCEMRACDKVSTLPSPITEKIAKIADFIDGS